MEASRAYKSLERGLRVIEAVVDLGESATFANIARKTGLPRSTAHHLLRALVEFGYLVHNDDTRHYRISHKLFRLTERTWTREQLADIAMPFLEELSRRTHEGTSLAVLLNGIVTIIAKHEHDGPVRVAQEVGAMRPIHCTAVGKALAAGLPARELDGIIERTAFEKHTPKTITSPDAFRQEISRIRETGIAIDNEEHINGIRCLAAPVRDHSGSVRAALCVIGPKGNLPHRRLGKIRLVLNAVTAKLSERLGYGATDELKCRSTENIPAAIKAGFSKTTNRKEGTTKKRRKLP